MDRRAFLRRAALVASGAVAADQLELLDRLGWVRRFFAGFGGGLQAPAGQYTCTLAQWDALLHEDYVREQIVKAYETATPFKRNFAGRVFVPSHYTDVRVPPFIEVVRG